MIICLPNALFKLLFYSVLLVFYMFRTFYVHHQEDYNVHAALYGRLLFSTTHYSL